MSKPAARKPSPNTVRPNSPKVTDSRKFSGPKSGISHAELSKNRKSPSIFGPERSVVASSNTSSKPKPIKNMGMLDDKDLLSQSAYFDEADSEIQSIYERVVLDRHMQSSLQEIIAAQKLQARQSSCQRRLSHPNAHLASSQLPGAKETNTSSGKESNPTGPSGGPSVPSGPGGSVGLGAGSGSRAPVSNGTGTGTGTGIPQRVDEDQRSDNTTSAGYMLEGHGGTNGALFDTAALFRSLGLPEPDCISDETITALFDFAQKEICKRNIHNVPGGAPTAVPVPVSVTVPTHSAASSSGTASGTSISVSPGTSAASGASGNGSTTHPASPSAKPPSGRRSGPSSPLLSSTHSPHLGPSKSPKSANSFNNSNNSNSHSGRNLRPRSKSGGCEAAVLGVDHSASTVPIMDDDEMSESGRLPPTEKMLGLAPGYLGKPSPAGSPWMVFDGAPQSSNSSNSPIRPVSSSSPLPIHGQQYGTPSSGATASLSGSGRTETHPSRETGVAGGPLRLPAKKLAVPPLTLFNDYFTGAMKQQKSGQKNHRYRDNEASDFHRTSATAVGISHPSHAPHTPHDDDVGEASQSQQLQQLVISPRTAFDDISVSSSVASSGSAASSSNSCSRGRTYSTTNARRAPTGAATTAGAVPVVSSPSPGAGLGASKGGPDKEAVSTRQKR